MRLSLATMAVMAASANAAGISVWKVSSDRVPEEEMVNERLKNVPQTTLELNWEALTSGLSARGTTELEFSVKSKTVSCTVSPSDVVEAGLLDAVPSLRVLSGPCDDGSIAAVTMDVDSMETFSATITSDSADLYVDYAGAGKFTSYAAKDARMATTSATRSCDVTGDDELVPDDEEGSRLLEHVEEHARKLRGERDLQTSEVAYRFRLAVSANKEYSAYHGGTLASTSAAVVTMMQRVNGVYLRELSLYFQLIASTSDAFCTTARVNAGDSCRNWPNDSSLYTSNPSILTNSGISSSEYDLGHSVSTGGGGVGALGSLCTSSKARGTTGQPNPVNDPYFIDYVAHEIGHQLSGYHSFRDCGGNNGGRDNRGAVEPGSGSSIMGYAGICGNGYNLQSNSDAYFNSINLEAMRNLVQARSNAGCGERFSTGRTVPTVSVGSSTCTVPKGNYVQLKGELTSPSDDGNFYYAWDRVDTGAESYVSNSQPRFRSWIPIKSKTRFLPNMYYLTYGLGSQRYEIPPSASISGNEVMDFRFIARSRYSEFGTANQLDTNIVGSFGYRDVRLTYSRSISPLSWSSAVQSRTSLSPGQYSLTWSGGSSGSVEILIARVTIPQVSDFRYEDDLGEDLDWISLGTTTNDGSATVTIPTNTGIPNGARVNLMIRAGSESCYYFDLVSRLTWSTSTAPTPTPPTPTPPTPTPPTPTPPTPTPPSPAPSTPPSSWTCRASYWNANDGCDCDCGVYDPDCEDPRQRIYCQNGQSYSSDTVFCREQDLLCYLVSNREGGKTSEPLEDVEIGPDYKETSSSVPLIAGLAGAGAIVLVAGAAVVVRRRRSATQAQESKVAMEGSVVGNPVYGQ